MTWRQFTRLLDAIGFPRARSVMWANWAWEHFEACVDGPLSVEAIILALGYVMQGRKAEAVWDIENTMGDGEGDKR